MSRKSIAESLGLFTLAPPIKKVAKKDKEAQQEAAMLFNMNRDFFDGPQIEETPQQEEFCEQKKREKHLQQVDSTKKMFID